MAEAVMESPVERSKPNPVSLREYLLMDRHEQRAFEKGLTKQEKFDVQAVVLRTMTTMPLKERKEIAHARVAKLEQRKNTSIGDKVELVFAKFQSAIYVLPEKQPIFLRKIDRKSVKLLPKGIREAKSPYLMQVPLGFK